MLRRQATLADESCGCPAAELPLAPPPARSIHLPTHTACQPPNQPPRLPTSRSGRGAGITLTPFAAGHLLGGAVWRVRKAGDDYVYAVDFNHRWVSHVFHVLLALVLLVASAACGDCAISMQQALSAAASSAARMAERYAARPCRSSSLPPAHPPPCRPPSCPAGSKERHLSGTVLEAAFQRPALLITDSFSALSMAPERCVRACGGGGCWVGGGCWMRSAGGLHGPSAIHHSTHLLAPAGLPRACRPHKEKELLDAVMAALRGDGSVLLPIDTGGWRWAGLGWGCPRWRRAFSGRCLPACCPAAASSSPSTPGRGVQQQKRLERAFPRA